jgi:hypothetical protein
MQLGEADSAILINECGAIRMNSRVLSQPPNGTDVDLNHGLSSHRGRGRLGEKP